jgi:hypothetical protein
MHYEGLGRPLLRPLKPKRSIMYQFDVAPHIHTARSPTRPDMAPASSGRKAGVTILSPTRIGYYKLEPSGTLQPGPKSREIIERGGIIW